MQASTIPTSRKLSPEEFAAALRLRLRLRLRPQTIRAGLCNNGHVMGIKPVKLPNGRLLWDAAQIEALVSGEVA